MKKKELQLSGIEVAVVGIAGRFPGANNIDEYWQNLLNGKDSIKYFTEEELIKAGISKEEIQNPNYVKSAGGILSKKELFDGNFFDYSPQECELMNPQTRLFHEIVWEAIEDAGYKTKENDKLIGLYAASPANFNWEALSLLSGKYKMIGFWNSGSYVKSNFLPTWISYKLNLNGPSIHVDTACSSSLVAIHLACRSLLTGECEMAIAGGITVGVLEKKGYLYEEGSKNSQEGKCKPFDNNADGIVSGEGGGAVVLKLLENAIEDGDNIYAFIRGSAVNNDGNRKVGFAAPSIKGQTDVVRSAMKLSGVDLESIKYIEAHGTGTLLGDPIEFESLRQAFNTQKRNFCGLGSVKSNIGHLDRGAGVASFIKTVLALKHKVIPPTINFSKPNSKFNINESPFYIVDKLVKFENNEMPNCAGVTSIGIGGTNAHIILEEAPEKLKTKSKRRNQLVSLSAKSESALQIMINNLISHLHTSEELELADICFTLHEGRNDFEYRYSFTCSDIKDAINQLKSFDGEYEFVNDLDKATPIYFLFSGQGSQYVNMGRELYAQESTFRKEIDLGFKVYNEITGKDIKSILYPDAQDEDNESRLNNIHNSGPVKLIFEYSLAKMLINWGVKPSALIGHSLGEYTAACLAEVITLKEAIQIAIIRAELMEKTPEGAMMSIPLSKEEVEENKPDSIDLAAINTTSACLVSGLKSDLEEFEKRLLKQGIECTLINFPRASHSRLMESALEPFKEALQEFKFKKPQIPIISSLKAKKITDENEITANYWVDHMACTVNFSGSLSESFKADKAIYLQVGCDKGLFNFVERHSEKNENHSVFNLISHKNDTVSDQKYLLSVLSKLWMNGASINWNKFYGEENRQKVTLPTYPFEGERYWIDLNLDSFDDPLLGQFGAGKTNINDYFFTPSWKREDLSFHEQEDILKEVNFLIFSDDSDLCNKFITKLNNSKTAVVVKKSKNFLIDDNNVFHINPAKKEDYNQLFSKLTAENNIPNKIIHFWSLTDYNLQSNFDSKQNILEDGLYSLVYLFQSLENENYKNRINIEIISNAICNVIGNEHTNPIKTTILSPVKLIPFENQAYTCRLFELDSYDLNQNIKLQNFNKLFYETTSEVNISYENIIAYRNSHRWIPSFSKVELIQPKQKNQLKDKGVYLLVGGTGGIGLEIAEYLAKEVRAKLILIGKHKFPLEEEWNGIIQSGENQVLIKKIKKIQNIKALSSELLIKSADVSNISEIEEIISKSEKQFGKINGVMHMAGVLKGGIINNQTPDELDETISAKIDGTIVLHSLFHDKKLDFLVLFSSVNAFFPAFGQLGYCAANLFQDAYANHDHTFSYPVISINWTGWKDTGMLVEMRKRHKKISDSDLISGIPVSEGVESFIRIIHSKFNQVIVSERNIIQVYERKKIKKDENIPSKRLSGGEGVKQHKNKTLKKRPRLESVYEVPTNEIENQLNEVWQSFFRIDKIGIDDNFFELGGDSLLGVMFVNKYKEMLQEIVHVRVLFQAPTIRSLSEFFIKHYPDAVKRKFNFDVNKSKDKLERRITKESINWARKNISSYSPNLDLPFNKNKKAIFILSPPRCGSTLSRVILGGHPELFAPPELSLLQSTSLSIQNEGVLRTLMDLYNCKLSNAKEILNELIENNTSVNEFYSIIQSKLPNRILVDKSPVYSTNLNTLMRIEREFDNAMYIHLLRHPYGMIRSYDEAKLDLLYDQDFLSKLPFTRKEIAELRWVIANQNIIQFLEGIPDERKTILKFEDLVEDPTKEVKELCKFLDIHFVEEMLTPYKEKKQRMTDGVHKEGFMIGDIKFHTHKKIDNKIASLWKDKYEDDFVGEETEKLMNAFDYELINTKNSLGKIPKAISKKFYQLSSAQSRMYNIQMRNVNENTYNVVNVFNVNGDIDINKLRISFHKLVANNEILRTCFVNHNDEISQVINDKVEFDIPVIPVEEDSKAISDAISSLNKPFDLTRLPLFRIALLRISDTKHIFIFTIHHIICDGQSFGLILKEFFNIYNNNAQPAKNLHYKDYSEWQAKMKKTPVYDRMKEYWEGVFQNRVSRLELPIDYNRNNKSSFEGDVLEFSLDNNIHQLINQISKKEDCTNYMVFISALKILLSKICNQEDVIIGTVNAGRINKDLEDIVGMFVNTIAIRSEVTEESDYNHFLKNVKENILLAFENQEYQFEDIVKNFSNSADRNRNPIFDVFVDYKRTNGEAIKFADLEFLPYSYKRKFNKFDLHFHIKESVNNLDYTIFYNAHLFKKETIERIGIYFKRILEQIVYNNQIKIKDINLNNKNENNQLIYEFNNTKANYPDNKTVIDLLAERVGNVPDNHALVLNDKKLTYSEFWRKINQTANYLEEKGLKKGDIAAIISDRSIEFMVYVFAVLKAGGSFLPIDHNYPEKRIQQIIESSKAKFVLIKTKGKELINSSAEYINLDLEVVNVYSEIYKESKCSSEDIAYVIYTSGTSGKPKGVTIGHKSLVNYAFWANKKYVRNEKVSFPLYTSISFDLTITSMFVPLISGNTVVIYPDNEKNFPLEDVISNNQIEIIKATPSHLKLLKEFKAIIQSQETSKIKRFIVGGETLTTQLAEEIHELFNGRVEIYNEYGPTEATVGCMIYKFDIEKDNRETVLIGTPIDNAKIYILNKQLKPLPIGVFGEMYISGDCLSKGYLYNLQLNNQKFIDSPFVNNEKLYLSGDLARWLPDGNVDFKGRIDNQVQIRGFRIECSEIEANLNEYNQIAESLVLVKEINGEQYLIAYYVSENEIFLTEIKSFLIERIPDYMIPSFWVKLDQFPLTNNGKIDFSKLPEPEISISTDILKPENDIEAEILFIWSEVLNIESDKIGVETNFFEIGGHSILTTKVSNKIQNKLKTQISLADVYNYPTIRELSMLISKGINKINKPDSIENLVLIRKGNTDKNIFFVHAGSGEIEVYIELCNKLSSSYNYWGIRAEKLENCAPRMITIEEIAENYNLLIKGIQKTGPFHLVGWCTGGTIVFDMIRQLELKNEKVNMAILLNTTPPVKVSLDTWKSVSLNIDKALFLDNLNFIDEVYRDKIQSCTNLELLYIELLNFMNNNSMDSKIIRELIKSLMSERQFPTFEKLNINDLIYYFSVNRTYLSARRAYIPKNHLKTKVHYIAFTDSNIRNREYWNKYLTEPMVIEEVKGDHFVIGDSSHVPSIASIINRKTDLN